MVYNQLQGRDAPHSLIVSDLISGAWQLARQQTSRLKQEKVNGVKKERNLEWPKNLILIIELSSSFHQGAAVYRLWGKKKGLKAATNPLCQGAIEADWHKFILFLQNCPTGSTLLTQLWIKSAAAKVVSLFLMIRKAAEETMMTPGDWCTLWVKRNLNAAWENNQIRLTGTPEHPLQFSYGWRQKQWHLTSGCFYLLKLLSLPLLR